MMSLVQQQKHNNQRFYNMKIEIPQGSCGDTFAAWQAEVQGLLHDRGMPKSWLRVGQEALAVWKLQVVGFKIISKN